MSPASRAPATRRGPEPEPAPEPGPSSVPPVPPVLHLRRDGTSVVLDLAARPAPVIVHWGADLGDAPAETLTSLAAAHLPQRVSGGLDRTARLDLLPTPSAGWTGTPGLEGHRDGAAFAAHLTTTAVEPREHGVTVRTADDEAGLAARHEIDLLPGGLLRRRLTLRNTGATPYSVQSLLTTFPIPWDATEILDTTGRHLRERSAQRHGLTFGTHLRESRRGRPGADATLLLAAGTPGFGFERGTVHAIHVAWSGNQRALAERVPTGEALLAGGALHLPGEIVLAPGQEYAAPDVLGSWGEGLNDLAARFHTAWRARPHHPRRPRPVTLNTWEAVYFDHDRPRLTALAEAAAAVGVERFVLDDGWFRGRRDDTAGLGDWYVDADVWPDGLHPLVDVVTGLGMEFGLWVEPEMVNPDSDLAREHPDWILRGRTDLPPSARQQQVLDLANPAAYAHLAERLDALLDEYPIAYLKWDHNRDVLDPGSGPGGVAHSHAATHAVYRLFDDLKAAHPGLEIESCASGGARVDLGILERTDRIWTSDCLDPVERLENQRYTGLVVPPEMMGMHLTGPRVHSTHRHVGLALSGAVALFGHHGIEWDLTTLDDAGRDAVAAWVALFKEVRPLVAQGRLVHADTADPGLDVRGVVAPDRARAYYTITQVATSVAAPTGRVRLPGLDPDAVYRVRAVAPGGMVQEPAQSPLVWAQRDTLLTGRQLDVVGVRPPVQYPQHATVIEVAAI